MTELEDSIAFHKSRIKSLRASIADTESQIKQFKALVGGGRYDDDALKASNEHSQAQIKRFREEIVDAQLNIRERRRMMEVLEKPNGVVIDADAYG